MGDRVLHRRRSEEGTPLPTTLKAHDLNTHPTNAPYSFIQIPQTLHDLHNDQP